MKSHVNTFLHAPFRRKSETRLRKNLQLIRWKDQLKVSFASNFNFIKNIPKIPCYVGFLIIDVRNINQDLRFCISLAPLDLQSCGKLRIETEEKLIWICNPAIIKFLKKYDYFHCNGKFTAYFSGLVENLLLY